MGSVHYEQASKFIEENSDLLYFSKPCSEELVVTAEKFLGLRIPPIYRRFLHEFGFLRFGGAEIYGILDENFMGAANDLSQTLEHREHGLPKYMILVSFLDDGEYAALDTRFSYDPDECPVIVCAPGIFELGDNPEKLADDFGEFFLNEVIRALKFHKRM